MFLIMFFGALYYYKERMLFADASHIAFSAINEERLQIQQFRFGAFITQIVPVLGAKFGLSIKTLMLAYSAGFNFFYLSVAAILLFVFKAYRLLVLYTLYWVLVTTHSFFWTNNEVHQGIAYMFLLFSALLAAGERKLHLAFSLMLLIILGTTALFCHPLVIPPFVFLWFYLIAEGQHWHFERKQTIILTAVAMLIVVAKVYVSKSYSGYDSNLLSGVSRITPFDFIKVFSSPLALEIYRHIPTNYGLLVCVFVAGVAALFIRKQFFLAFWTIACSTVYFILLCLTFTGFIEFNTESELMPIVIIMAAPFALSTLVGLSQRQAVLILLFIFALRLVRFQVSAHHFVERVDHLTQIMNRMKQQRLTKLVLVKNEPEIEWRWMLEWGFPAESMMLSALAIDKPIRQFVVMTSEEAERRVPKGDEDVIVCFDTWPSKKLNRRYFPFDTTRPYTVLSYEEFTK
jgi:hypothetical protein